MRGITRDTVSEMVDRKALMVAGVAAGAGLLGVFANDFSTIHIDFGGSQSGALNVAPDASRVGLHFLVVYLDLLLVLTVLLVSGILPSFLEPKLSWFYFGRPMDRQKVVLEKIIATAAVYSCLTLAAALPATMTGMMRYSAFDVRIGEIILVQLGAALVWTVIASSLGVLLRSAVKVIFVCFGLVAVQVIVAARHTLAQGLDSPALEWLLKAVGFVVPATNQLSQAAHCLADGQSPVLLWPVGSSLLFALVLIYSAVEAVKRRDL